MGKGGKKLLMVVAVVFVVFWVVTQPQQTAGLVRDLLNALQEGAEALITFLRSLFA